MNAAAPRRKRALHLVPAPPVGPAAEMTRCTDPIPLHPATPELVAKERQLLAGWDAEMTALVGAGWVIVAANTMENPIEGSYRKFNLLRRTTTNTAPQGGQP